MTRLGACRTALAVMKVLAMLLWMATGTATAQSASSTRGTGSVTLIHIGDLHGHLVPRADAFGDSQRKVGGLAQLATVVERIRQRNRDRTLLVNVGDAVQGSAEALFTRGQAVIDALAPLRIDAYVPGNWDYVYGIDHFVATFAGFGGRRPLAPWPTIASNLYYATPDAGMRSPYVDVTGERVLPPFLVRDVGGVRVGIIGITTTRGPRALGRESTRGLTFTPGDGELTTLVARLRDRERVDLVVVASELELANNVRIAESTRGIDVVLSADMHELTREPIVTSTGTVIVEEGQDGTAVGELTLAVRDGAMTDWQWRLHTVTDSIPPHAEVARRVASARRPFLAKSFDRRLRNPINGTSLAGPIDEVVGYTRVALHRANSADHGLPAVMEGSSHDFLGDALRAQTRADIGLVRGFRFGTHVRPGPITREDLYHFLPIGSQVAVAEGVPGSVIWRQLESSIQGALADDPREWTGGWFVGVSGVTLDVDPYAAAGSRIGNVRVNGAPIDTTSASRYSVAGLWFSSEPDAVSNCVPCVSAGSGVRLIETARGQAFDAVDLVAAYLAATPDSTVSPETGRVRLVRQLPPPAYRFPELQPLQGVSDRTTPRSTAGQTPPPARH
jgi:2',3'-cyclic-nucleotide 2'-phosphodiesterase (5'-nucleotidase family)